MTNLDGVTEQVDTQIEDTTQQSLPGLDATEVEGVPETPAPEPVDYLEIDDSLAAKHVRVKIDGEEVSVPLNEALQGYQRQADYTRKTSELAEQRRQAEEALQVQQALQANPGLTMQVLAARAGMSVEDYLGLTPRQQQQAVQQEDEYADPLEQALADERQARMELQRRFEDQIADQHLSSVVSGLKASYGIDDSEARAAVQQTAQMGLGIDAIPLVYRAMAFEKLRIQQQVQQESRQTKQLTEQQRQAAAAAAQATVASGGSAAGVSQTPPNQQPTSIREAIEMSYDEIESRATRR